MVQVFLHLAEILEDQVAVLQNPGIDTAEKALLVKEIPAEMAWVQVHLFLVGNLLVAVAAVPEV
jgi:hypothetical protein